MRSLINIVIILVVSTLVFIGCENGIQKGDELSKKDIEIITNLGLLEQNERIIEFHSQSGQSNQIAQAGNFYSNKRIASYWIEQNSKSEINSAFYSEIDTITTHDFSNDWSTGSFLKIRTNTSHVYNVYVNGDQKDIKHFFNGAIREWENKKRTTTTK
jgi:hypothetical protein